MRNIFFFCVVLYNTDIQSFLWYSCVLVKRERTYFHEHILLSPFLGHWCTNAFANLCPIAENHLHISFTKDDTLQFGILYLFQVLSRLLDI